MKLILKPVCFSFAIVGLCLASCDSKKPDATSKAAEIDPKTLPKNTSAGGGAPKANPPQ